jgi:hypothetical protein
MIFVCRNNINVIKLRPEVVYDARTFNAKQFSKNFRDKNEYVKLTAIWMRV